MTRKSPLLLTQPSFIQTHAQIECIRVPKIFDWVVVPTNTQQTVPIPEPCLQTIQSVPNLTVECMSLKNGFELLQSDKTQILSLKRLAYGLADQMAVATFLCSVPVTLSFLNGDLPQSPSICTISTSIQVLVRDVVICLPQPLNKQNIVCSVINCEGSGIVAEKEALLDLHLCISVQVEAEVKLEIPAKFCQPRQPIPVSTTPPICPEILFPPQCSFFPPRPAFCPILITDKFCGNFQITCNGSRQTLWENVGITPSPSGTITILLQEGCTSIDVLINSSTMFEVQKEQSISHTFDSLEKVEIQCQDPGKPCIGKYCMTIHYFVFVPTEDDSTNE
jgi:hypothetical protein